MGRAQTVLFGLVAALVATFQGELGGLSVCVAQDATTRAPTELQSEDVAQERVAWLRSEGRLAEARELSEHWLNESERAHGRDDPRTAWWVVALGAIAKDEGRLAEAEAYYRRALEIYEKTLGREDANAATCLAALGAIYREQGRFAESEAHYKRALAIQEKALGPDHPQTAVALNNLGLLYGSLGRTSEAVALLERALAITKAHYGTDHLETAASLSNLATQYVEQARFAEAERLYLRAIEIRERKLGTSHRVVGIALANLGTLYRKLGRYREAERILRRSLAISEASFGADHPTTAARAESLALLLELVGRQEEAEQLYRRALVITERHRGPKHADTATSLSNLGTFYVGQGRYPEAEPLLHRALAISEEVLGPEHPETATSLNNLALLFSLTGRRSEAVRYYRRTLTIDTQTKGVDHPSTALSLNNLALALLDQGDAREAESLLRQALAVQEKVFGPRHLETALSITNLGDLFLDQGKLREAETLLRRAAEIYRLNLPQRHPDIASSQYLLSRVLLARDKIDPAFESAKISAAVAADLRALATSYRLQGRFHDVLTYDQSFLQLMRASYARAASKPSLSPVMHAEVLWAAQHLGLDETGVALANMAARFAAGSDGPGAALREQQELLSRRASLDVLIANAIGAVDPTTREQAVVLRLESDAIGARLKEIDSALRRDHAAYADLVNPLPMSLSDVQALLAEGEAIALFVADAREIYLIALSASQAAFARAPIASADLDQRIATLRRQLDPDHWQASMMPFDRALAHRLYRELWAPLERVLDGKKQVFVVPTSALTSLPLSVLLTQAPSGGTAGDADPRTLRESAWLAKRHALVTLPSISSLKALRVYANKGRASEPFAGFGDPALAGTATARDARSVASMFRGVSPDPNALRTLSPLPAAAGELKALAAALGASPADVYLRERATEAQLKSLDLSRKRVIAFATHALTAGEMGLGEPGLVFTPPGKAGEHDDGYLAASEAARLDLRADWIILSACNTAAGSAPGAKGLSGLARAFFLAGARSLLVSHWSVWDDAAGRITTATLKTYQANPGQGRAEALRQAMLTMMQDPSSPRFAHPAAWAPFVLVGEAGVD